MDFIVLVVVVGKHPKYVEIHVSASERERATDLTSGQDKSR